MLEELRVCFAGFFFFFFSAFQLVNLFLISLQQVVVCVLLSHELSKLSKQVLMTSWMLLAPQTSKRMGLPIVY